MDLPQFAGAEIVGEALQLQCGPAADDKGPFEHRLERDDNVLPAERLILIAAAGECRGRSAVDAAGDLFQPAMGSIFAPKSAGIASALQPVCIDDQPFREIALQTV